MTPTGTATDDAPDSVDKKARRSTIGFPYVPLSSALEVPRIIHERYGTQCDLAQLAAGLDTTLTSSRFRTVLAAAKLFQMIETRAKVVELTELGMRLVDPEHSDAARAEAFLAVPLYRAIYDQFEGRVLPPGPGLEGVMGTLGVTERSVARARQIMYRSAEAAGFFEAGADRLVPPPRGHVDGGVRRAASVDEPTLPTDSPVGGNGVECAAPRDQLLAALWALLPADSEFPNPQRSQWLRMVELALDMVYGSVPSDPIEDEPF